MSNFIMCTDHTVAEVTIVDQQGHPSCPFCKIEELQQYVKDCSEQMERVIDRFYRDAHPVDQRLLTEVQSEIQAIVYKSEK